MRYDRTAVVLHWVIGLAILGQFALGHWMHDLPKDPDGVRAWWFGVHGSIGLALGALVAATACSRGCGPFADGLASWN